VELTLAEHEDELARQIRGTPQWRLADDATTALAMVIEESRGGAPRPASGSPGSVRLHGLAVVAVRTLRAARAGMQVLASGYEVEARAFDRVLLELKVRCRLILNDATGQQTVDWMRGRHSPNMTAAIKKTHSAPDGYYAFLSPDSHGDAQSVARALLLDISGVPAINWGPAHSRASLYSLHTYASYSFEVAVHLAEEAGVNVSRRDALARELHASVCRLREVQSA
jgi:hypothetical protein